MNAARWRALLLALAAFGLVCFGYSVWQAATDTFGTNGIAPAGTAGRPFLQKIRVSPNTPAARAGLRSGDVLDLRPMSGSDRYQLYNLKFSGRQMDVYVLRNGRLSEISLTAAPIAIRRHQVSLSDIAGGAGLVWILLFAGFLAWRCPDSVEGRILSLILTLTALFPVLGPGESVLPWPVLDAAKSALFYLCLVHLLICLYASRFARPLSTSRKALFGLICVALAVWTLSGWAAIAGAWYGTPALESAQFGSFQNAALSIVDVCMMLFGIATAAESHGVERTRFLWAFLPIGVLILAAVSQILADTAGSFGSPNVVWVEASDIGVRAAWFLMPLGLTYSLLSRRLMDVGFIVNRAAIFSGVSIVIVGLFVLAEWALSEWMSSASHETNIAISAGLALLLGLSIRFVHAKVEHVVDHVMFRKRREDEEAIRKLSREAPYITDEVTLLERIRQTLLRHAGASFVDVLLDDGRRHFGGVNENDPALVTLRAEHARLDLHATQTAIEGEWAYPMVARGRLVGTLVLGPKQSQESYAPDESAAIAQLAHSVAGALDLLNASQSDTMLHELRDLRMVVSTMAARLDGVVTLLDGTRA